MTGGDLASWPAAVSVYLNGHYAAVEEETGVTPTTDFISGPLFNAIQARFQTAGAVVANIETGLGTNGVQEAPLAVQGSPPASGLFSFDKYSALPVLVEAIRDDVDQSGGSDANRRLFLVPKTNAIRLNTSGGIVQSVSVVRAGQGMLLPVSPGCAVILAASAIETTRLALHSFPTALMGRNLMAHVRSDFTVRIRRSALPSLPTNVETAALLVRGLAPSGRFHIQVTASANPQGSETVRPHDP